MTEVLGVLVVLVAGLVGVALGWVARDVALAASGMIDFAYEKEWALRVVVQFLERVRDEGRVDLNALAAIARETKRGGPK